MKNRLLVGMAVVVFVTIRATSATTWYVATNGNDSADGTNWFTAKATIQAAIDAVVSNGNVIVSNGVYATGGRVEYDAMTNRVVIYKPIVVKSVNGPSVTTIQGAKDPLTTNGDAAVRCVYLASGATLVGFTITNGATRISHNGGGVWCQSATAIISNCVISGNSALNGGGSCDGTLYNCTLTGNSATESGGGARTGALYNCTLSGNSAEWGGGSYGATLYSCTIYGNSALNAGGSFEGALYNCTLTGNSAAEIGGGEMVGTLYNCIVYFNTAPDSPNCSGPSFLLNYVCTTPDPGGTGIITNDPQFADAREGNYRLSASSPCIDQGNNADVQGTADLDGRSRIAHGVVDMGAYENQFTIHFVDLGCTNPLVPYTNWLYAATNINSAIAACQHGDIILVTNGIYQAFPTLVVTSGISLASVNGPFETTIDGLRSNICVSLQHPSAELSGFTITRGCSDYADGAAVVSQNGGMISNCIIADNITSNGSGAVLLGSNSRMVNTTICHNYVTNGGAGGVYCMSNACLINCTIYSNVCSANGGGVVLDGQSRMIGSLVFGNQARSGGGVFLWGTQTVESCTIVKNSSVFGGGIFTRSAGGGIQNSTVYFNLSPSGSNYDQTFGGANFANCCVAPAPASGSSNVTSDPLFVNTEASNYRLSASSPCIDKGNNADVQGTADLDGRPRVVHGLVDIGAYEFQGYWAWSMAITNGLTNLDDCATGDGYPNLLKYAAGSNPTNSDELARLAHGPDNGLFSMFFSRNTNASDVTLIVEGANALTNDTVWNGIATNFNGSWGGATNVTESGTTNPVAVTVRDFEIATNRFIRLRVTRP